MGSIFDLLPREFTEEQREHHLGCCPHHESTHQGIAIIAATLEKLLMKFEEQYGVPKGDILSFSQANPAQNTNYTSPPVPYNGVVRSLIIAGNSNVTLSISNSAQSSNLLQLCKLPCGGSALSLPHRIRVPNGATFTLATDSAAGTGIVSLSAWIEPVALSGQEHYRVRR